MIIIQSSSYVAVYYESIPPLIQKKLTKKTLIWWQNKCAVGIPDWAFLASYTIYYRKLHVFQNQTEFFTWVLRLEGSHFSCLFSVQLYQQQNQGSNKHAKLTSITCIHPLYIWIDSDYFTLGLNKSASLLKSTLRADSNLSLQFLESVDSNLPQRGVVALH